MVDLKQYLLIDDEDLYWLWYQREDNLSPSLSGPFQTKPANLKPIHVEDPMRFNPLQIKDMLKIKGSKNKVVNFYLHINGDILSGEAAKAVSSYDETPLKENRLFKKNWTVNLDDREAGVRMLIDARVNYANFESIKAIEKEWGIEKKDYEVVRLMDAGSTREEALEQIYKKKV